MNSIRETLFDLLLNSVLQIGLFSIVAAAFSGLVAKMRAKHQYSFYLTVLLFCLAVPVINTLSPVRSVVVAPNPPEQVASNTGGGNQPLWIWRNHSERHAGFTVSPEMQAWIIGIWGVLVLLRLGRFSRALYRVHQVRTSGSVVPPALLEMAGRIFDSRYRVAVLASAAIDDPVTVGVFHPAILLPTKVLPKLGEQELSAILAHEYGHICRRDFPVHILCELISLPVAWHPGIRHLMSKISQTRELACDSYAAARLGKRRSYANSLLNLASLCLHVPRGDTAGLGIFESDNLETRIMKLTEKTRSLSRAGVIGLALATTVTFGAGAVLAHAMSLQASSGSSNMAEKFAGTWHWMFDGKSFSTMTLVRSGSGIMGSVTPSQIALNDDGGLRRADPSEDSTPKPIAKAALEGSALHVTVQDGKETFEFLVTLKDDTHAEIHPIGAPPNMKPIPAEKVQ